MLRNAKERAVRARQTVIAVASLLWDAGLQSGAKGLARARMEILACDVGKHGTPSCEYQ